METIKLKKQFLKKIRFFLEVKVVIQLYLPEVISVFHIDTYIMYPG